MSQAGNELVVDSLYSAGELREIASIADAVNLAKLRGFVGSDGNPEMAEVLGDGFEVMPTAYKAKLVDEPFFILTWFTTPSTKGGEGDFVSMRIVDNSGRRMIINDGGAGIKRQLDDLVAIRKGERPGLPEAVYRTNLLVPHGLRVSRYKYTNDKGVESEAETFYLSTN